MPFVKRKKRPEISSPTNFEHRVHSGYDHNTGVFVGLPTQWNSIINETEQQKMLQQHILNNTRLANTRPKPIVDPSRITPNELNCFKTIVRGNCNVSNSNALNSLGMVFPGATNNNTNGHHNISNNSKSPMKQQHQQYGAIDRSPNKEFNNNHLNNHLNNMNGVNYGKTSMQTNQQANLSNGIHANNSNTNTNNTNGQMKHHHLNSILPLVESALSITENKSIGHAVKKYIYMF